MAGLIQVGVREFREALAEYLDAPGPVAITRHGQTVGYYVPARREADEQGLAVLRAAVSRLESVLAEYGVGEDEVVNEFGARRGRS